MIQLKVSWRYCVAFYAVIMLYVSFHELVHHFVGFLICGEWGTKSFNSFETTCEEDPRTYIATYAGPIFSYIMMYVGMIMLKDNKSDYQKQLGFAIIFAQLPFQRITGPLFGFNDEYYATGKLLGFNITNQLIVFTILLLICLPPLIKSFKAIGNRRRILWFCLYLLLFPYLLFGPIFGLLEYLMVNRGFMDQAIIGIGLLFIVNEIITIILHLVTKKWIVPDTVT